MAKLSNINGKFAVEDTGAIRFSNQTGTTGQILKSNGNAAPTWVAASTVIGGPYLPLSGGTLTGATATASGISFTVGGALTGTTAGFSGSITASGNSNSFGNTTIAALSASTGTFSASVTAAGNSNSFGTTTFAGAVTISKTSSADLRLHSSTYSADFNLISGATGANKFGIYDNNGGAYRILIDSSGNATFAETVDAKGFRTTSGSTDYSLLTRNSSNTAVYIQQAGSGNILDVRYGSQAAGQGTSAFAVNSSGNSTFAGDVKIAEASNKGQLFFGTANTDYEIKGGGNYGYLSLNAPILRFDTGGSERMRITSGGNVGIGTTAPSQKLHVIGNVEVNASSAYIASYNNTTSYQGTMRWAGLQLGNNGTNRIVAGRTAAGGSFQFWTNNTNDASNHTVTPNGIMTMSMLNTGNVGFGVTSPNALLSTANSNSYTQEWTFAKGYRHFTTYPAGNTGNYNISTKISFNNLRGITVDYYESGHLFNNGAAVYFRHTRFYIMMEGSTLRINDAVLIRSTGNRTDAIVNAPAVTTSASLECLITSTIKSGFTHYVAADIVGTGFNRVVSIS